MSLKLSQDPIQSLQDVQQVYVLDPNPEFFTKDKVDSLSEVIEQK